MVEEKKGVPDAVAEGVLRARLENLTYSELQMIPTATVVQALFVHLNGFDYRMREALKAQLPYEHRTLQQLFVRWLRGGLEVMAQQGTDARNERAVGFAKRALAATEEMSLPLI